MHNHTQMQFSNYCPSTHCLPGPTLPPMTLSLQHLSSASHYNPPFGKYLQFTHLNFVHVTSDNLIKGDYVGKETSLNKVAI